MSAIAPTRNWPRPTRRPALTLLRGDGERRATASATRAARPPLSLVDVGPCILVAGEDPRLRAAVRRELAAAMAPGTLFTEAGFVHEVLERAPHTGVVMLTGDLRDISAGALTQLLARRHPRLPIVTLDAPAPAPLAIHAAVEG